MYTETLKKKKWKAKNVIYRPQPNHFFFLNCAVVRRQFWRSSLESVSRASQNETKPKHKNEWTKKNERSSVKKSELWSSDVRDRCVTRPAVTQAPLASYGGNQLEGQVRRLQVAFLLFLCCRLRGRWGRGPTGNAVQGLRPPDGSQGGRRDVVRPQLLAGGVWWKVRQLSGERVLGREGVLWGGVGGAVGVHGEIGWPVVLLVLRLLPYRLGGRVAGEGELEFLTHLCPNGSLGIVNT